MEQFVHPFNFANHPKLVKALKYLAWFGVVYLVFIFVYSIFYWYFVSKLQTEFLDHVFWWLKNTGVWYVFAPICLVYFTRYVHQQSLLASFLTLGIPIVVIAACLQISFDYSYLKDDLLGYFVLYLPKQIGIFLIVYAYWFLFIMNKNDHEYINTDSNVFKQKRTDTYYLDLEHLGLPYKLDIDSVHIIKSAGNYVEIESEHGQFLKRASLKQMQLEVPEHFCQCHRSAIVNLQHIRAMSNQSSGHVVATLSNGEQTNISKRYKNSVKDRLTKYPIQAS